MKNLYKLFISAILLVSSLSAMAQEWHFGPTVGYENSSLYVQSMEQKAAYTNFSGFNIGVLAAYDPIEYLSIQAGVTFVMNGYKITDGTYIQKYKSYLTATEDTKLFDLCFPVYVIGKIPVGNAYIDVECGPNLYAGLSSHTTVSVTLGNQTADYKEANAIYDKTLSRFNCAIHLAGGVEYEGFRFMVGYNFGVFNMLLPEQKKAESDYFKTSGFVISLSYLF